MSAVLLLGCRSAVPTHQYPRPFHAAVGCWRLVPQGTAQTYLRKSVFPGPVTVRLYDEPDTLMVVRLGKNVIRQIPFRLDILAGLRPGAWTEWFPLTQDSALLRWTYGTPPGALSIHVRFRADSLWGLGSQFLDTGPGDSVIVRGSRISC